MCQFQSSFSIYICILCGYLFHDRKQVAANQLELHVAKIGQSILEDYSDKVVICSVHCTLTQPKKYQHLPCSDNTRHSFKRWLANVGVSLYISQWMAACRTCWYRVWTLFVCFSLPVATTLLSLWLLVLSLYIIFTQVVVRTFTSVSPNDLHPWH